MSKEDKKNVMFRRVKGRIVPIRSGGEGPRKKKEAQPGRKQTKKQMPDEFNPKKIASGFGFLGLGSAVSYGGGKLGASIFKSGRLDQLAGAARTREGLKLMTQQEFAFLRRNPKFTKISRNIASGGIRRAVLSLRKTRLGAAVGLTSVVVGGGLGHIGLSRVIEGTGTVQSKEGAEFATGAIGAGAAFLTSKGATKVLGKKFMASFRRSLKSSRLRKRFKL